MFSCEIREIFKNTFFGEYLGTAASVSTLAYSLTTRNVVSTFLFQTRHTVVDPCRQGKTNINTNSLLQL